MNITTICEQNTRKEQPLAMAMTFYLKNEKDIWQLHKVTKKNSTGLQLFNLKLAFLSFLPITY